MGFWIPKYTSKLCPKPSTPRPWGKADFKYYARLEEPGAERAEGVLEPSGPRGPHEVQGFRVQGVSIGFRVKILRFRV